MAESIETRTTRFDGLSAKVDGVEPVLQKILDKLSAMEQRQAKADELVAAALNKTDDTARRLQRLELQSPPSTQQQPP
jgi:chromosome segregation ATPase